MLAGHYAPALLIRARTNAVPLWALCVAVQAVDILFFILAAGGLEGAALHPGHHPRFVVTAGSYTHSLLMTAVYAGAAVLIGRLMGKLAAGVAIGLAVASHWVTDFVVHAPDLPLGLAPDPRFGLSLWSYPTVAWALEVGLVVGCYLVLRRQLAGRARRLADGLCAGLCLLQTLSTFVVPMPPTVARVGYSAWAIYTVVAVWAWRVDRAGAAER